MHCLKCGEEIYSEICPFCGMDLNSGEISSIWEINDCDLIGYDEPAVLLYRIKSIDKIIEDIERLKKTDSQVKLFKTGEYKGELKNEKRNGFGIQYDKTGAIVYAGNWLNGCRHGFGRIYNHKRECEYEGYFKNGERHGRGKVFHCDGTCEVTIWDCGRQIKKRINRRKKRRKELNQLRSKRELEENGTVT